MEPEHFQIKYSRPLVVNQVMAGDGLGETGEFSQGVKGGMEERVDIRIRCIINNHRSDNNTSD